MKSKNLILPFAAIVFLFLSCSKPEEQRSGDGEEDFDPHPTWTDDSTNNFWEKGLDDGIAFDPGREEDTTLFI